MWAQSINLIAVAFDISWLYEEIEDFRRTVLRNTFVKIVSMVAIFVFIKSSSDVALYIAILAISTFLGNLVKLILAFVTATGTVMLPYVANAFAKHDMKKVHEMLYKSFDFVSALAYPMMFGIAGVSLTLAPLYYSAKYAPVGPAMLIESIVILMIGWSNVIGTQYLLPVNRVKDFTTSVTIGAVVNIILNFPFISLWGLNGAMWATVLSEVAVTGY